MRRKISFLEHLKGENYNEKHRLEEIASNLGKGEELLGLILLRKKFHIVAGAALFMTGILCLIFINY